MDSRQFIESGILETYAMGLASEQEAKQVAEMAARYPEVKAELAAIEASMENFDKQNAVEPPAHLKAKILSQIGSGRQESGGKVIGLQERLNEARANSEQPKQSNFFKYAAAVALILLFGGAIYTYNLSVQTTERIADLEERLRDKEREQEKANAWRRTSDSILRLMEERYAIVAAPGMKSIELKGMEVSPDAKAMVYANTTNGDSYLEIMNLPPAPDGMQYQFWGIVDGKPVDAGMIPLEGDTSGIHSMKTIPNAVAYAISLEPKGGSLQPQGKIYVMGNS